MTEGISKTPHPLVLVCAGDERFALGLGVMLYSALANYRGSTLVELFIFDGGICTTSRERIERIVSPFQVRVHWIEPKGEVIENLPQGIDNRFSASAYFRLLIPELLPGAFEKAIYLDSDLIVQGDLAQLWAEDVEEVLFLATLDGFPLISLSPLASCPGVTIRNGDPNFNSGVMVMNLTRWRAERLADKAFAFARKWSAYMTYADQDAMNAVAIGKWRILDPIWNQYVFAGDSRTRMDHLRPGGIVHFVGEHKPWLPSARYPTGLFDGYMRDSAWFSRVEYLHFRMRRDIVPACLRQARHVANRMRRLVRMAPSEWMTKLQAIAARM